MIRLYRLLTQVLYGVLFPYGRWRAGSGDALWQGRLGRIDTGEACDVWLHAASVGETRVMSYLINKLRQLRPNLTLHLTVMTRAGHTTAKTIIPDSCGISFFPLDAPTAIRRLLDSLRPRLIVIAETEIWPALVTEASPRCIPMVLVNGRMSERSFKRYQLLGQTVGSLLNMYDHLLLKSETDRERYRAFGVAEEKMTVAGDMKFDAPLPARSLGRKCELRYRFGLPENAFVWVAGSTRSGEEQELLTVFDQLAQDYPHLYLVLAPRHIDRIPEIRSLLESTGNDYRVYGETDATKHADSTNDKTRLLLIDRMGLLNDLYLCADVAFVGGTLVNKGGHNILEPVWAGLPVLFGPSVDNIRDAAAYVESHGYGKRCGTAEEIERVIRRLLEGEHLFARKQEDDNGQSATAVAATYISERLHDR